jgi:hypothetical protein
MKFELEQRGQVTNREGVLDRIAYFVIHRCTLYHNQTSSSSHFLDSITPIFNHRMIENSTKI